MTLLEASFQLLALFLLLHRQDVLLQQLGMVVEGVVVHYMHEVNTIRTSLLEVTYQQVSLLLGLIFFKNWIV